MSFADRPEPTETTAPPGKAHPADLQLAVAGSNERAVFRNRRPLDFGPRTVAGKNGFVGGILRRGAGAIYYRGIEIRQSPRVGRGLKAKTTRAGHRFANRAYRTPECVGHPALAGSQGSVSFSQRSSG